MQYIDLRDRFNGDIIYVGKGKNIQNHVNQLFLRTSKRNRAMLKEMDSVTFEITGSELIARIQFEEVLSNLGVVLGGIHKGEDDVRPRHRRGELRERGLEGAG